MPKQKYYIPQISLKDAVEIVKTIARIAGKKKRIAGEVLAEKIGHSPYSSSFIRKVYTLKNYGLIDAKIRHEKVNDKTKIIVEYCELTELSTKIIDPIDEQEKYEALREAFMRISLFKEIFNRYQNTTLPSIETLGPILVREYEVSRGSEKQVYRMFIESARFANLVEERAGEIILTSEIEKPIIEKEEEKIPLKKVAEDVFKLETEFCSFYIRRDPQAIKSAKILFEIWIKEIENMINSEQESKNKKLKLIYPEE